MVIIPSRDAQDILPIELWTRIFGGVLGGLSLVVTQFFSLDLNCYSRLHDQEFRGQHECARLIRP